ncbi:MFS transporter [Dehalogenimonas sp. THU2]|uniref:MDR family MFS transporter n=1 Tax=Dehalogenimonas sp. THU2 TaxID=3151121 RepID=UPI0032181243
MVTLIGILNSAGFSLTLPFLSLYLHQQRDIPMTVVGLFILVSGLVAAAAQMYAGMLSDRFGRRPLILWSMSLGCAIYIVMAVLVSIDAPVWSIVGSYILVRCGLMAARPATSALVVDLMPKGRLAEGYGLLRMGQNLGFGFGPVIGGYFWLVASYAWLFGVAAVISGIALAVTYFNLKESSATFNPEKISLGAILTTARDRTFLGFTLISIIAFMGLGQFISTLSVYTVDRIGFTTIQYGSLLTLNAVLVVALQYPAARWVGKMNHARALFIGMMVYAVGYLSLGLVGPYGLALMAMGIITLGEILFSPVSMTVVAELSPPSWRGRYQGFYGLAETLGISLGPTLGGALLDRTAPDGQMSLWAPIAAVIMLAGFAFYKWGKQRYRTPGIT